MTAFLLRPLMRNGKAPKCIRCWRKILRSTPSRVRSISERLHHFLNFSFDFFQSLWIVRNNFSQRRVQWVFWVEVLDDESLARPQMIPKGPDIVFLMESGNNSHPKFIFHLLPLQDFDRFQNGSQIDGRTDGARIRKRSQRCFHIHGDKINLSPLNKIFQHQRV